MTKPIFTNAEVLEILPHRKPFLFIDEVLSFEYKDGIEPVELKTLKDVIGSKIVAKFTIRENLKILEGHFPGNPILPGVVQMEMMAQAVVFICYPFKQRYHVEDVQTLLVSVDKAKFRKPLSIGDELHIHTQLVKQRGPIAVYDSYIMKDNEKVSECSFFAKLDFTLSEKNKEVYYD